MHANAVRKIKYTDLRNKLHHTPEYPACIPHVSRISDTYLSRYIMRYMCLIMYLRCSRMYLDHPCRYMYPACIPHVSRMYPASQIRTSQDTFEIHVSHNVSRMYLGCILITLADTCIPHGSRMDPAWIPHGSRMDPAWIPHGSRMDPAWVPAPPPLRHSSRAPLGARAEGLATVPFPTSPAFFLNAFV